MAAINPAILDIVIKRDKMNQPPTVAGDLPLATSQIKPGSNLKKKILYSP